MASLDERNLIRERDFYRRLLDLGAREEIEPLLDDALGLIVEVTGAHTAYLELYDDQRSEPRYWRGHGCTNKDVDAIRTSISRGIIAETVAQGRTVETGSALHDPRFHDLGSVRHNDIQAVVCVPIGCPPVGVVYLAGGPDVAGFAVLDRERVEVFARQLSPLAARLVAQSEPSSRLDHTSEIRSSFRCDELVGRSVALAKVLKRASHVAPLDVDILITGPSGTGKSALARAIVANSSRASAPFVELNCAAIPAQLLESELFGVKRGAHSTATKDTAGKVAAAEGGTLFLDEIGELELSSQSKLLQLLQERVYFPLGSNKPVRADVRIMSATHVALDESVAAKTFRADLYYRLHVVPLEMPGLAIRREDIPLLVEHFCAEAYRRWGFAPLTVSARASLACQESPWPGHVRQLAHRVEAAVIEARGEHASTIEEHHLFPAVEREGSDTPLTFQAATGRFQRRYVLEALERADWNVTEAARQLGLARSHVYNLIKAFALRRE